MKLHRTMGTFKEKLVDLPEGATAIPSKWVFCKKHSADGTIIRYKACLCAQGNHEQGAEDKLDSYSPVARITSIRILLTIAHRLHYVVYQMDIKTAYLYEKLECSVYMRHIALVQNFSLGVNSRHFDVDVDAPVSTMYKGRL